MRIAAKKGWKRIHRRTFLGQCNGRFSYGN